MFVGHLALALMGKRNQPSVSLGWYVAAVTALDMLWPVFLLAGVEQVRIVPGATAFSPLIFDSYPWSHSLLLACGWAVLLAGLARWRGVAPRAAVLLALLVVSHWMLDVITHAPDLPLWPGSSPRFGFGLWNSIPGTFLLEGGIWLLGLVVYVGMRPPLRGGAAIAFWSLVLITTALWASGPFGPPPPDTQALAWFVLILWILVPWAAVADRRRAPA